MQTKKEADVPKKDVTKIIDIVLKAVAVAMGVAVTVLSAMDKLEVKSGMGMLGIGLACVAISLFKNKGQE